MDWSKLIIVKDKDNSNDIRGEIWGTTCIPNRVLCCDSQQASDW